MIAASIKKKCINLQNVAIYYQKIPMITKRTEAHRYFLIPKKRKTKCNNIIRNRKKMFFIFLKLKIKIEIKKKKHF